MKPYYEDGSVTIYHADCRLFLPWAPHPLGFQADLVLTDPPYGIYAVGGKWGHKADLGWDREPADFLDDMVAMGKQAIVWGGNYYALPPSRGWLVWYKRDAVPSAASVELAWTSMDMNARLFDWTIAATNAERVGHPTQKPEALMRWCLALVPAAQTILDPFAGSGSTLRAAKDMGRRAIGIELSERYCEIAAKRMQQEVLPFEEASA